MKFQVNEGPIDRLIRVAVGAAFLYVASVATGLLFYVAVAVGVIALLTGITGFCPTYVLLGISTVPKHANKGAGTR